MSSTSGRRYVVAIASDPGLRSGYAIWTPNTFRAGITDPEDHWDVLERFHNRYAAHGAAVLSITESFRITPETGKKAQDGMNWPLELIGVHRYLAKAAGATFVQQTPRDAMAFATDDKLRQMGWWTPGKEDHARDATRHLIRALHRRKLITIPRAAE